MSPVLTAVYNNHQDITGSIRLLIFTSSVAESFVLAYTDRRYVVADETPPKCQRWSSSIYISLTPSKVESTRSLHFSLLKQPPSGRTLPCCAFPDYPVPCPNLCF